MAFPKVGNLAPKFSLSDHEGNTVSLADFKGKSAVVVYFYHASASSPSASPPPPPGAAPPASLVRWRWKHFGGDQDAGGWMRQMPYSYTSAWMDEM